MAVPANGNGNLGLVWWELAAALVIGSVVTAGPVTCGYVIALKERPQALETSPVETNASHHRRSAAAYPRAPHDR